MKIVLIYTILLTMVSFSNKDYFAKAIEAGKEANSNSKKAYKSKEWEETKQYLKKAKSNFDDAKSFAEECKCKKAYEKAEDGISVVKKGISESDWDNTKKYAKKARNKAEDFVDEIKECKELLIENK